MGGARKKPRPEGLDTPPACCDKGPALHPPDPGIQTQAGGGGRSEILAFISRPASKRVGVRSFGRVLLLWGRLQVLAEGAGALGAGLREPQVRLQTPAPEGAGVRARGPAAAFTPPVTSPAGAPCSPLTLSPKETPRAPPPAISAPSPHRRAPYLSFGGPVLWRAMNLGRILAPEFLQLRPQPESRGRGEEEENESGAARGGRHQDPDRDLGRQAPGARAAGVQGALHPRVPTDPLQSQAFRGGGWRRCRGKVASLPSPPSLLLPFRPMLSGPLTHRSLPGHPGPRVANSAAAPPPLAWPAPVSLRVGGASWAGPGAIAG